MFYVSPLSIDSCLPLMLMHTNKPRVDTVAQNFLAQIALVSSHMHVCSCLTLRL
jgi:hypothetical protein